MKQFETYLTFVQNMHLIFVSQCSKTKTFGRCLKKALSREVQCRFGNTPQLFKASLISCTDICINFMENLRILQPLKSLENKLQQNIYTFRTLELTSHLKQYILEIVLIMARKNSKQIKRQRHKISVEMFLFLIKRDWLWKEDLLWAFKQKKPILLLIIRDTRVSSSREKKAIKPISLPSCNTGKLVFSKRLNKLCWEMLLWSSCPRASVSPLFHISLHPHLSFSFFSSSFSLYSASKQMLPWTKHNGRAKQHV